MPLDNRSWSEETDTSSIPKSTTFSNQSRASSTGVLLRICTYRNETVGSYCGSFEWVDLPMCRHTRDVIPSLLRRIKRYEIEEEHARAREARLEDSKSRFHMVVRLLLIGWASSLLVMALAVCRC
ncbi:hypothetical protein Salat_2933600 [Sesamum alatum]|uniref:Zinc finger, GRF-type n=1 Tax=Sesamum alatum TaxID=300844 RepID=A0AAE2C8D9_9LAMI|nr:hypothetical protein Salat_2933600 [Sesamum alatum]